MNARPSWWPSHLPRPPASFYIVQALFDLRRDRHCGRIVWGNLTDCDATWDDVQQQIAEHIDDVRALCHPPFGFRVLHIDGPRVVDVTAQALEPHLTDDDRPAGLLPQAPFEGVPV